MDWNLNIYDNLFEANVEAYTASWIEMQKLIRIWIAMEVEAYTASWIEIVYYTVNQRRDACRSLYGFVDWNWFICFRNEFVWIVEAYTASWIEILRARSYQDTVWVEAYTASWIEMKHLEM